MTSTTLNPVLTAIQSACASVSSAVVSIPVIGQILSELIAAYCSITISFMSTWPLPAFGIPG